MAAGKSPGKAARILCTAGGPPVETPMATISRLGRPAGMVRVAIGAAAAVESGLAVEVCAGAAAEEPGRRLEGMAASVAPREAAISRCCANLRRRMMAPPLDTARTRLRTSSW